MAVPVSEASFFFSGSSPPPLPSRCGHCKKLEPTYNELGAAFAGTDVVIAKMDGTENEVDGLSIKGFPTIKFYPKGKKVRRERREWRKKSGARHCRGTDRSICVADAR